MYYLGQRNPHQKQFHNSKDNNINLGQIKEKNKLNFFKKNNNKLQRWEQKGNEGERERCGCSPCGEQESKQEFTADLEIYIERELPNLGTKPIPRLKKNYY